MQYTLINLRAIWNETLAEKKFAMRFYINFVFCFVTYLAFAQLVAMNKYRPGAYIDDTFQQLLTPHNFSVLIFSLTYSSIIIFVSHFVFFPRLLYSAFQGFTAVFVLRAVFIFLLPLAPPHGQIALIDPFLDIFVPGSATDLKNDLFFSGHVADVCFLVFCCQKKWIKKWVIVSTSIVGLLLIWQRVHYTADVVSAPFFAYVCYCVFMPATEPAS